MEGDRGKVDDGAAGGHQGHGFAAHQEAGSKVQRVEFIPGSCRGFGKFDSGIACGIVDQGAHRLLHFGNGFHPRLYLLLAGEVDRVEARPRAEGLLEPTSVTGVDIAEADDGALPVERFDDGGSDAVGASGDDDEFVSKFGNSHGRTMPNPASIAKGNLIGMTRVECRGKFGLDECAGLGNLPAAAHPSFLKLHRI